VPSLEGRVVVVAGADTESGGAAATDLAAAGAHLVLVGDDTAALGALGANLHDAYGTRVAVYTGDPRDGALAEMTAELFGNA
jgi:short-subunit dehydrogenase